MFTSSARESERRRGRRLRSILSSSYFISFFAVYTAFRRLFFSRYGGATRNSYVSNANNKKKKHSREESERYMGTGKALGYSRLGKTGAHASRSGRGWNFSSTAVPRSVYIWKKRLLVLAANDRRRRPNTRYSARTHTHTQHWFKKIDSFNRKLGGETPARRRCF